jgi:hypothetical protein
LKIQTSFGVGKSEADIKTYLSGIQLWFATVLANTQPFQGKLNSKFPALVRVSVLAHGRFKREPLASTIAFLLMFCALSKNIVFRKKLL